ncbi:inner membrane transporter RhtA [Nocardioides sp. J9]|uniref:EamA family transporter n=1 Tax=unclassified Nocardioides TaxID=2615069 RepID=UPI0004BC8801|nr:MULTISPECIES: EamA family transporter [unclassified Nocardioides]TWG97343.1 inner membrane transporter RhtA [Nocardioides sp. J9]
MSATDHRRPALPAAIGLVVLSIASVQLGAGFAKLLFEDLEPDGVVWLRLATSALVLLVWARPRLRGRTRLDWLVAARYGACLGLMNWAIYQSFSRIPIGVAVTIEFIGPLVLAAVGFRRPRDLGWVVLAAVGVVLLGFERGHLDPAGVAFALLAGAGWAGYILSSAATGARWPGIDGLAVAALIAVGLLSPLLLTVDGGDLVDDRVLLIGAAVGLLSSVVPYSAELVALRTLPAATFGVLMSLEPAAAALAGLAVVGEDLAPVQWLAIGCVVVASVGATRATRRPIQPPDIG